VISVTIPAWSLHRVVNVVFTRASRGLAGPGSYSTASGANSRIEARLLVQNAPNSGNGGLAQVCGRVVQASGPELLGLRIVKQLRGTRPPRPTWGHREKGARLVLRGVTRNMVRRVVGHMTVGPRPARHALETSTLGEAAPLFGAAGFRPGTRRGSGPSGFTT
jgi:hypothetical protein